jgi:esterase/lipase superfamily enzyme
MLHNLLIAVYSGTLTGILIVFLLIPIAFLLGLNCPLTLSNFRKIWYIIFVGYKHDK